MRRMLVPGTVVAGVLATLMLLLPGAGTPVLGQGTMWVQQKSAHDYSATLSALKRAVPSNGMMVLGQLNQQAALSMTGLHVAGAHAFFVGNPGVGKKLFEMDPAAGADLPPRIYVWADKGGTTYVGYFKPSALLGEINPKLGRAGAMIDGTLAKIVSDATK